MAIIRTFKACNVPEVVSEPAPRRIMVLGKRPTSTKGNGLKGRRPLIGFYNEAKIRALVGDISGTYKPDTQGLMRAQAGRVARFNMAITGLESACKGYYKVLWYSIV